MSDKTVDEIMGLVDKYVDYCEGHTAEEQESVREALRDAIRAICDERDQAVEDLARLERTVKFMEESYLAEHGHWGRCSHRIEKDVLKARVVELEKAIMNHWWESCDEEFTCIFCATSWSKSKDEYPHHPDCIVRTIEGK